ncbi:MAG: hypothetical protein QXR87_07905 [Candidatus Hadarchaeales archaeon]
MVCLRLNPPKTCEDCPLGPPCALLSIAEDLVTSEEEGRMVGEAIERYRERYTVRRTGALLEVEGLTPFDLAEGLVRSLRGEDGRGRGRH